MRNFIFFVCLGVILAFQGCNKGDGQNARKKRGIFALLHKKIDREFTDSVSIERFLTRYPYFREHKAKLYQFYKGRNYELAWSEEGAFLPQASMFVNLVKDIRSHGLNPIYDPQLKQKLVAAEEAKKPYRQEVSSLRKEIDLLLTATFFEYADEIWKGKINPEDHRLGWNVDRKRIKTASMLETILADHKDENPFLHYEPLHPQYLQLKNALASYFAIRNNGGWPEIHTSSALKSGDSAAAVVSLKQRLWISGEYKVNAFDPVFTPELETALKKFQERMGLDITGKINSKTLKELNIPVEDRIKQIIVNMERWRWIPENLPPDYVWINIPEFKMHVYEGGKEIFDMNVIVGKTATSTPIFNDVIEYIVASPSWHVPEKIAKEEVVPRIQKDSTWLVKMNMEVLQNNKPVDPNTIHWQTLSEQDVRRLNFRQAPGDGNALGRVKFLFPNEYDVYLHDTPEGHLFSQSERDFSHGCIRIQEPLKLAKYLLRQDSAWTEEKIKQAMYGGKEQFIKLKAKEPVYIVYFTVWVDSKGTVNFREDLYKHDSKLEQLFFEENP